MSYSRLTWVNGSAPARNATNYNHSEAGIQEASDRLDRLVYDVKNYGAVGDGSTADHVAIQAALTAAGTAGGGIVYLSPGTYIVAKYLLIPSNVTVKGAGMGISVLKSSGSTFRTAGGVAPEGSGYSMLQATGVSRANIAIQDLTVDGNESADRTALAASGVRLNSYLIDIRSVTGLLIERVATRNTWTYNIAVIDCLQFVVNGCNVQAPGTTGVYTELDGIHIWGSRRGRVTGNYVDNFIGGDADDALVAHVFPGGNPVSEVIYANNVVRAGSNGHGLQLAGASTGAITDLTITGNVFWGGPRGIAVRWYSASGNAAISDISITGNVFTSITTSSPIYVAVDNDGQWRNITIAGNTIDTYGDSTDDAGVLVEGGNSSAGVSITGNAIRGGYSRGISLSSDFPQVRDYVIANNMIDMSSAAVAPNGIVLGMSRDGVVVGNTIVGRGTTDGQGILLTSTSGNQATNQLVNANRVRAFNIGIQVSSIAGNNPTNTVVTSNITQGCTSGVPNGTATFTSANNL